MKQVALGTSGLTVSELCVGTMVFGSSCDEAEADRILSAAIDHGATFLDTAEAYSHGECESLLGRLLQDRRDQVTIATKCQVGIAPEEIVAHLDKSLQRLQTDHIDLYYLHWPHQGLEPRPLMQALHELVTAGKVRALGCCNCPAWLVERFNAIAALESWTPMSCHQVPYNLIERGVEIEVLPQALNANVAIVVYRSLLMGILAGKYPRGRPAPAGSRADFDRKGRLEDWITRYADSLEQFDACAADLNITSAQLAIAWVRHCPAATCTLAGFSSLKQFEPTLAAFDIDLTDEQYDHVTGLFDTEVKEEAGGNYAKFRRMLDLIHRGASR